MDSTIKEPHTISLKVLRLSRPQLATQDPLPEDPTTGLSHQPSLALPSASIDDIFTLTPLLTFPNTFGTAYVGENFSCILSVNNELPPGSDKRITSVKLAAEMQTPSQTRALDFNPPLDSLAETGLENLQPPPEGEKTTTATATVAIADSSAAHVQSILTFDLREEGTHVLCVNISYTESTLARTAAPMPSVGESSDDTSASAPPAAPVATTGGRVRLLRKLYNFNVGPCLSVRTKATAISPAGDITTTTTTTTTSTATTTATAAVSATAAPLKERYLLECQLENLADDTISMERLVFDARVPFTSTSLNWDAEHVDVPILAPREVTQVAFLIAEGEEKAIGADADESGNVVGVKKEMTKDGRAVLGVLTIHWRSAMGCLGVLSTGWLASRPRKN